MKNVILLDIETAGAAPTYSALSQVQKDFIAKVNKGGTKTAPVSDESWYMDKAALYPEVGLITAIGVYNLNEEDSREIFYLDTMGKDLPAYETNGGYTVTAYPSEKELLTAFSDFCRLSNLGTPNTLNDPFERGELFGHNILNFDLPFLAKRMAINGMGDHAVVLKLRERYWHTDTSDIWRGSNKNPEYITFDLLCRLLNVPTPKAEYTGKDMPKLFWSNKLTTLVDYLEGDMVALERVYDALM